MAGCEPDVFPVVLAAIRAVLDPAFDLAEVQVTTNCAMPALIVNGPAQRVRGVRVELRRHGSGTSCQRDSCSGSAAGPDGRRRCTSGAG